MCECELIHVVTKYNIYLNKIFFPNKTIATTNTTNATTANSTFFPAALLPNAGHGLIILDHTTTHHSRKDSSGPVISSSHRPLLDITQYLQKENVHISCRNRTNNLSRLAAADLLLLLSPPPLPQLIIIVIIIIIKLIIILTLLVL